MLSQVVLTFVVIYGSGEGVDGGWLSLKVLLGGGLPGAHSAYEQTEGFRTINF